MPRAELMRHPSLHLTFMLRSPLLPHCRTDHHGGCREFDHTDGQTYSVDGDCTDSGVNQVHGAWSTWTAQGSCSASCGDGSQTYTRTCDGVVNGGNDCSGLDGGSATKTESCKIKECPVNGAWSGWTAGSCSTTCGDGTKTSTRTCDGVAHGGDDCSGLDGGSATKTEACKIKECPIDGGWSDWSACTSAGTKTRTCTNPSPAHLGADCSGSSTMSEGCNGWKEVGNSVVDRAHPDGASNIQFVDTSKCFTSAGFVTSAKMYIGSASTGGRMQIYTPTGGSNYKLKAESEVFNLPTGLHTKAFANPMEVAAGDCVGWYHSGAGFIDYDSGGNAVRWNYGHHGVGTTINFDGSGARTYAYSVNKVSGF